MSLERDVIAALDEARSAGRLRDQHLRDLRVYGAETIVLLAIASYVADIASVDRRLISNAVVDRLWDECRNGSPDPDGDDRRAATLTRLALQVLDAGRWPAIATDAWSEWIGDGDPEIRSYGLSIAVDMSSRSMRVSIPLHAHLEDWTEGRDGLLRWPIVTGRVYGDPTIEDGRELTFWAQVLPGEREALTLHQLLTLGRRRS